MGDSLPNVPRCKIQGCVGGLLFSLGSSRVMVISLNYVVLIIFLLGIAGVISVMCRWKVDLSTQEVLCIAGQGGFPLLFILTGVLLFLFGAVISPFVLVWLRSDFC